MGIHFKLFARFNTSFIEAFYKKSEWMKNSISQLKINFNIYTTDGIKYDLRVWNIISRKNEALVVFFALFHIYELSKIFLNCLASIF